MVDDLVMEAMMNVQRVGLWAAAIFVAGHVSGCAFAWLAAARADDGEPEIVEVKCDDNGFATYTADGRSAADLLLSVRHVQKVDSGAHAGSIVASTYEPEQPYFSDGKVAFRCSHAGDTLTLAVR